MDTNYLLSVRLMTYNHEKFIRQAMEGILMQQVDFKVEVVIGDDFSNDKTLEIIKEYSGTVNIDIKVLERPENGDYAVNRRKHGRLYNFINIIENCYGKYVALLDGDDYWTDPQKLKKQVDFLENNSEYSISFCGAKVESSLSNTTEYYSAYVGSHVKKRRRGEIYKPAVDTTIDDLAKGNYMHTPGIVFRNIFINQPIPEYMYKVPIGDWPLMMFVAKEGKIKFMEEEMCQYRVHQGGVYSQSNSDKIRLSQLFVYAHLIGSGCFSNKHIELWKENSRLALRDMLGRYTEVDRSKWESLFQLFGQLSPDILLNVAVDLSIDRRALMQQLEFNRGSLNSRLKGFIRRILKN